MGIGEFIKGQFLDNIEHIDEEQKLLVYKYNRPGNEIKIGSSLIVRNGQIAVWIYRGKIADIFQPGAYVLNRGSLPLLSSLIALPYLFNSPIKSDLYFINTTQFIGNRWGTKNPIMMRDSDFNIVRIRAFGTYSFRITNPKVFIENIFGARKLNMTYDILQYISSFVSEAISEAVSSSGIAALDLASNYRKLSDVLKAYVNSRTIKMGIEMSEIVIENISLPETVEKLIDEQSGVSITAPNMNDFVQYQTVMAMRDAANQSGGLAGIGAGVAFGSQIASFASNTNKSKEKTNIEKIREFKELLDDGIITDEEFQDVKKKLLGI